MLPVGEAECSMERLFHQRCSSVALRRSGWVCGNERPLVCGPRKGEWGEQVPPTVARSREVALTQEVAVPSAVITALRGGNVGPLTNESEADAAATSRAIVSPTSRGRRKPASRCTSFLAQVASALRSYWPLLFLLASIWGASYLFIEVAVDDLPPAALTFLRLFVAAVLLAGYTSHRLGTRRALEELRAAWLPCVVLG